MCSPLRNRRHDNPHASAALRHCPLNSLADGHSAPCEPEQCCSVLRQERSRGEDPGQVCHLLIVVQPLRTIVSGHEVI